MNDAWNVTQYREQDVDQEIRIATPLEEDTKRRKENGETVRILDSSDG